MFSQAQLILRVINLGFPGLTSIFWGDGMGPFNYYCSLFIFERGIFKFVLFIVFIFKRLIFHRRVQRGGGVRGS